MRAVERPLRSRLHSSAGSSKSSTGIRRFSANPDFFLTSGGQGGEEGEGEVRRENEREGERGGACCKSITWARPTMDGGGLGVASRAGWSASGVEVSKCPEAE